MKKWRLNIIMLCLMLILQCSFNMAAQPIKGETIKRQDFIHLIQGLDKKNTLTEDLKVRPQDKITREEVATLIIKLLGYEGIAKTYEASKIFTDVTSHKGEIHIISELGIMSGIGNGLFNPKGQVTEEEAKIIINRIEAKLDTDIKWLNGFYALSSSSQMKVIPQLDAVSFGWARVQYDEVTKEVGINTSNVYGNEFAIPTGFETPLDLASSNGVEKYLMVYLEDQFIYTDELGKKVMLSEILLTDDQMRKSVIDKLIDLCNGITKGEATREFDGITIDFEGFYNGEIRQPFNIFLKELKTELIEHNKKLNVAVHPNTYFKGYDYKGIGEVADKVILMAHDYEPKVLTQAEQERGIVITPQTPINQIYEALKAITHPKTGVEDKNKIVLQISFASTQWQVKDGKILNSRPYTPTYDKIYQRLISKDTEIFYDKFYQNPYAVYTQDGIRNVIWYENESSVQAKIGLAKLFDIYNISFWRLGTIPDFQDVSGKKVELNVLNNKNIFDN